MKHITLFPHLPGVLCGLALSLPSHAAACPAAVPDSLPRLRVGGYGEMVYTRNFFSDNIYRYQNPARYASDPSHARVDLPHAVLSLSYDFGRGWKFNTEIEFEHGGTGGSYEQEYEEGGEWEQEREQGGEVAIEQFWLEKRFAPALHVRAGHIIVPVGLTNARHEPLNYFGVYRPEGESRVLPCTWHSTGVSLWGTAGRFRYEAMAVAGLNALNFSRDNWVQGGSQSPFEYSVANRLGFAARVDYRPSPSLRLGLSGYFGESMHNSSPNDLSGTDELGNPKKYAHLRGTVTIAALDFTFRSGPWRMSGSADYGHLSDAAAISQVKKNLVSNNAPTDKSFVGEAAYALGLEAGYDLLSAFPRHDGRGQLYVFARYDQSDSYIPATGMQDYAQTLRRTLTAGLNYYPLPQIAVKAQYAHTWLRGALNNEPSVSLGIVYQGYFL